MRREHEPGEWQMDLAPRLVPETYPGAWPDDSILLAGDRHFRLHLRPNRRLGQARILDCMDLPGHGELTEPELPLAYALGCFNVARVDERVPVLAVGSNAAPAQLRYKYADTGVSLVMPLVKAKVEGLAAGVAADVAGYGAVPATPVLGRHLTDELFVEWLDLYQLALLDATEGGYERLLLPAGDPAEGGVRITLPSGEVLGACYAYVHLDGCLVMPDEESPAGQPGTPEAGNAGSLVGDGSGPASDTARLDDGSRPRLLARTGDPLPDGRPGYDRQSALIESLLAGSTQLRDLMGDPAEWFVRGRKPGVEEKVHRIFEEEGWTRHQLFQGRIRSGRRSADERQAARRGPALTGDAAIVAYGRALPARPPDPGTWRVVPSADDIDRHGQAIVRVTPAVNEALGHPAHLSVRAATAVPGSPIERMETIAGVVVAEDAGGAFTTSGPTGADQVVEVDEVLRLALGVEVGEDVVLTPIRVHHWRWMDRLVGDPFYVTCRVQLADPASAEREVCLLDPLTLDLMGVRSGAEVVVEGRAGPGGEARRIRLKALAATDSVRQRREAIMGGDFGSRFPSARDALGVDQEVPWIYLDSAQRTMLDLGRQRLAVVRVRPSRSFQLRQELREMLLVLGLAFIGVIEVVTSTAARVGVLVTMVAVVAAAISVRLRGRLTRRMVSAHRTRRWPWSD